MHKGHHRKVTTVFGGLWVSLSFVWNESGLCGGSVTGKDGEVGHYYAWVQDKMKAHRMCGRSQTNQHTETLLLSRIGRLMEGIESRQ